MESEHQIDALIKAGWQVLESEFDPDAFHNWRLRAFECVSAMFGSDHVHTKYFEHLVR